MGPGKLGPEDKLGGGNISDPSWTYVKYSRPSLPRMLPECGIQRKIFTLGIALRANYKKWKTKF